MGIARGGSSPLLGTVGRLAQLAERPVYIRQVGGSSPSAATNNFLTDFFMVV